MKKKCNSKLFSKKRDWGNGEYEEDTTEDYYRSSFHKDYIDYIVGMTDNYAKYISHQLNGMSY